jgi:hypothetical protein
MGYPVLQMQENTFYGNVTFEIVVFTDAHATAYEKTR